MDKTELIERFGSFSLNKIETRGLALHDDKYIFRMDDIEDCIDARSLYIISPVRNTRRPRLSTT